MGVFNQIKMIFQHMFHRRILIVSILILAVIGLAFLIHQAPAIGWILSILFWIGVIRYWNKKK